jgi:amidase
MAEQVTYSSATHLLNMLRERKISAEEMLELHLERLRELNPSLNAVIAVNEEAARKEARKADVELGAGRSRGALHGLPMTVKDAFEVVGMPTTCGLETLRNHVAENDADAVRQLRQAGAIIFGKSNVPAGAGDHQTYNTLFGRTVNPWSVEHTPGGSSGGAAAAVASGMSAAEIGSDIGGSIRVPAHFCGLYGHNPSFGLVPLRGHIPPTPGSVAELPMAVAGPIARSAFDLELLFDALAVPGDLDRKGKTWRLPPPRQLRIGDFRVAVWADNASYPVEPAYQAAIEEFADELRRVGAKVARIGPPIDPTESRELYALTLFGMWSGSLPDAVYESYASAACAGEDESSWAMLLSRGSTQSLRDWNRLGERREAVRYGWRRFFADYDVLICPATSVLSFRHKFVGSDHTSQLRARISVGSTEIPYLDLLLWPGVITLAKLPSTVVPLHRLVDGRPAGVQVVSDFLDDRTSLRFAQLLEQAIGGFRPPRGLVVGRFSGA